MFAFPLFQIVIIKWHIESSIRKFTTRHLMNMKYDIMNKQTWTTSEKQLIYFLGKKHCKISVWTIWVFLFNKAVKNIISNYLSHETIAFDDRDLPWSNKKAKQLTLEKNERYKRYVIKDSKIFDKVKCIQNELGPLTESNKQKRYYSRLSNELINPIPSSAYIGRLSRCLKKKKNSLYPTVKSPK